MWLTDDGSVGSNLYSGEVDKFLAFGWRAADGTVLTWDQVAAQAPDSSVGRPDRRWIDAHFTQVHQYVTGDHLIEVELRGTALAALFTALTLGATLFVVSRRRPY